MGTAYQPSGFGGAANITFTPLTLGATSTLVGWYNTAAALNNYNPIWGKTSNFNVYYGSGAASGKLQVVNETGPVTFLTSVNSLASGWHLLVIEDDGVAVKAYYDNVDMGNSVGSYITLAGIIINKTNQGINTNNFVGSIQELAVFDRALTAAERTLLWNGGLGVRGNALRAPFNNRLRLGYHLDDGSGTIAVDFSGYGRQGTLSQAQWGGSGLDMPDLALGSATVDTKVTALTELTTVDPDDLIYVVHAPATLPASMKAKASKFSGGPPSTNGFRLTLAPLNPVYAPQPATPSSTDTTADTCTFAAVHGWESGTIVTVSATIGGLTAGTRYYINKVSTTVVSFHTSVAAALAGTSKVDLTATMTSQVIPSGISNSTLYLTPFNGAQIGLYNGTAWVQLTSAEVSLALGTLTSGTNYDVFAYSNAGVLTLELLAWTDNVTRATAIARQDGVWCKSGALTRRYIGTIRTDSTTTTIDEPSCVYVVGPAKNYLYNAYNQVACGLKVTDPASTWTYTSATFRAMNNTAANRVETVAGLPGQRIYVHTSVMAQFSASSLFAVTGIGEDRSNGNDADLTGRSSIGTGQEIQLQSHLRKMIPVGWHYYQAVEAMTIGSGTVTFVSYDPPNNRRSGLLAEVIC